MSFLSLIESKREGKSLTEAQVKEIVTAFVKGELPDYQMAALLMAIYFRGLNTSETSALTLAMRDSGEVLTFPKDPRPLVDKHSTGGVGDNVSLPLAPLLACLGMRVPMISGRGLGITGGTLDKLESIPGFSTALTREQIISQVQTVGCVICGQTASMVPADKEMYALRDVTGTVPSIPLITASILSKKLAEGLQSLILDVKYGAAAFMPTFDEAMNLAEGMVALGTECGVNTRAVITGMDTPFGEAVGNWLEVKSAVRCLEGCGSRDLRELVLNLAGHLQVQCGIVNSFELACDKARRCLDSGKPLFKWNEMIAAQGANLPAFEEKLKLDQTAPVIASLKANSDGLFTGFDARVVGEVVRDLGGGRLQKGAAIQPDVGLDKLAPVGAAVLRGAELCRIHAMTQAQADTATARLRECFKISVARPDQPPLIQAVVPEA